LEGKRVVCADTARHFPGSCKAPDEYNALQPQLERKLKLEQYTPNYQERKRLFDADLRSRHGQFVPPIINTRPADLFDLYLEVMSR